MRQKTIIHIDDAQVLVPPIRLLSTSDNPFNPFTHWQDWFAFDVQLGYNTCAYLARIVNTSSELSELDQALAIDIAIDEILRFNITGNYIAISEKDFEIKNGLLA